MDINSAIHIMEKKESKFRVLLEIGQQTNTLANKKLADTSVTQPVVAKVANTNDVPSPLIINGTGVTALAIMFLFLFPVLITIRLMSNIHVSNRFTDHPLLLGKVEQ